MSDTFKNREAGPDPALQSTRAESCDISGGGAPVLRIWGDGRIEWSEDQINGGPPLCYARIDPVLVADALVAW